jgi:hypothetical protein
MRPELLGYLRIAERALFVLVVAVCVLWTGDYVSLRFRIPARDQFSSVTVRPYYAVPLNNGGTEFMFQDARPESCVQSLFPHWGAPPCWYLRRHTEHRINV